VCTVTAIGIFKNVTSVYVIFVYSIAIYTVIIAAS
jgi:hypothetical protein